MVVKVSFFRLCTQMTVRSCYVESDGWFAVSPHQKYKSMSPRYKSVGFIFTRALFQKHKSVSPKFIELCTEKPKGKIAHFRLPSAS